MPTVLISAEPVVQKPARCPELFREAGFEIRYPQNNGLARSLWNEEQTIEELRGCAGVIAGGEIYSSRVLSTLPDLRVIARAGVGFDNVDIAAATAQRIPVTVTPTANHEAVAEHSLALLFATTRSIVQSDKQIRTGQWKRTLLQPMRRKTLGILGLGRIGRSVALRAIALGMKLIATEKYPDEQFVHAHNIDLVDFDELLARSDYLSLHCPLTDETRGMFNWKAFAKMKPGSVLINTARGQLVVESDLFKTLQTGNLSAAGLDVFEQEPPNQNNPLFELDNVVLSPHVAGVDEWSAEDMGFESTQSIIQLHRGQWPEGQVINDQLKEHWRW